MSNDAPDRIRAVMPEGDEDGWWYDDHPSGEGSPSPLYLRATPAREHAEELRTMLVRCESYAMSEYNARRCIICGGESGMGGLHKMKCELEALLARTKENDNGK